MGYAVYTPAEGSWSHGDIPWFQRLLVCLIKPFPTADWWEQTLDLIEDLAGGVPAYRMQFYKSGEIVKQIAELGAGKQKPWSALTGLKKREIHLDCLYYGKILKLFIKQTHFV